MSKIVQLERTGCENSLLSLKVFVRSTVLVGQPIISHRELEKRTL